MQYNSGSNRVIRRASNDLRDHPPSRTNQNRPPNNITRSLTSNPHIINHANGAESKVIIRHSDIYFGFNIVFFELAVLMILISLHFSLALFLENQALDSSLLALLLFITFILLNIIVLPIMRFNWRHHYYEVTPGRIYYWRREVFSNNYVTYRTDSAGSAKLVQDIIGKILNCGTIVVQGPLLKDEIFIRNIPNPSYYKEVIEEIAFKKDPANL
ncbi:hypothetical protein GF357_01550 [Candidatus Dojkabacteria bacterium]|nr:hypothetical protein [Candidatus Dojkabacteria bacterium]